MNVLSSISFSFSLHLDALTQGEADQQRRPFVVETLTSAEEPRVPTADLGTGVECEKDIAVLLRAGADGDVRDRSVAQVDIALDDNPRKNGLMPMHRNQCDDAKHEKDDEELV